MRHITVLSARIATVDASELLEATPEIGIEAFKVKFLKNFRYPEEAIKAGVQGTYTLEFIVKEDGGLTSIKLKNDPGYGIAENAIRALRRCGKWKPALLDGKYAKVESTFEFTLNLKEFRRHVL